MTSSPRWCAALAVAWTVCAPAQAVTFTVRFPESVRPEPASGRLVVYLALGNSIGPRDPSRGPFFHNPQPMYGIDVEGLKPAAPVIVDDGATAFPMPPSRLPPGQYRAQAVLDMQQQDSSWSREDGNLYSEAVQFTIPEQGSRPLVDLVLTRVVPERRSPSAAGVDFIEVPSPLLSEFRGTDVSIGVAVVQPTEFDPSRKYPVIYTVPGFGDDEHAVIRDVRRRLSPGQSEAIKELWPQAFVVYLSPEGPNGHHLFANSANNGPAGDALVRDVIPELEKRYPFIPEASARLLRGHSSGGWSVLWHTLNYPDVFGGCWASAPDPVDFRRMQLVDIYGSPSMYAYPSGGDIPAYQDLGGVVLMTVRQEDQMEEVLGPRNTSGQQWDSWFAAWGPRGSDGNPADLFDRATGAFDPAVAAQYRKYDIAHLVRTEPQRYGPIFKQRIRLIVGTNDDYFLHEAVQMLKGEVDRLSFDDLPEGPYGHITVVPGAGHGSVLRSDAGMLIPSEMIAALRRAGHIP